MNTNQKSTPARGAKPALKRQTVRPPVYRPQPTPVVLQRKMASASVPRVQSSGSHGQPVAPPVYRPQTKKVAQPKIVNRKPRILAPSSGRAPASHVRSAPTVVQRTKMATCAAPQHTNVIQAHLEMLPDGTARETRTGQIYTNMGNSWVMDANGGAYYYTASHQYMTQSGLYHDPVTGMTLNRHVSGWYYATTGVPYYYDGEFYRPYQTQQPQQPQQPTIPHATSQVSSQSSSSLSTTPPPPSSSLSTSVAPPPSPSQQTQTQTSTSTTSRPMTNNDFRNMVLNASRQPDPFAAVRAQTTLAGSLTQLRTVALKSDENLQTAIEALASGSHASRTGIKGLDNRLSDERFNESHGGHAHAEYTTFQLFDELYQLWLRKGKTAKPEWVDIHSRCKQKQFDKKPPDRKGGGGGGKGELGGATHAPKTKLSTF